MLTPLGVTAQRTLQVAPAQNAPGAVTRRIALVIGNGNYATAPLANPVNDALLVAAALRVFGFEVVERTNVDHRQMAAAVRDFGDKLRGGGAGLFYFAGHGMQIKGRNFLIPVGAEIQREDEVAYAALDAQAVLDKMDAAGNGMNIMILDACRNNPFARSFRSAQQGLAQMDAPVGTMVAFATAPGSVASDGTSKNGLYTEHLVREMGEPAAKIEDVFKRVRVAVRRDSQNRQTPWEATSLEGDFYFKPAAPPAPPAPPPRVEQATPAAPPATPAGVPTNAAELSVWDTIKDTSDPAELRAYLRRYPHGQFAAEAKQRLAPLALWDTVKDARDPAELQAYLRRYPTGQFAAEAKQRLAALAKLASATPAAPSVPPSPPAAVAAVQVKPEPPKQSAPVRPAASVAPAPSVATATTAPSGAQPIAAPVPAAAMIRPVSASGYARGDTWRYQVVDKWKGEVIRNYFIRIDKIERSGDLMANKRDAIFDSQMRLKSSIQRDGEVITGERHWSPALPRWQSGMKLGDRWDAEWEERYHNHKSGARGTAKFKGSFQVLRREAVKVPSGNFDGLLIEGEVNWTDRRESDGNTSYGRTVYRTWFVPEIGLYAVYELEIYNKGNILQTRERHELTSVEVARMRMAAR